MAGTGKLGASPRLRGGAARLRRSGRPANDAPERGPRPVSVPAAGDRPAYWVAFRAVSRLSMVCGTSDWPIFAVETAPAMVSIE